MLTQKHKNHCDILLGCLSPLHGSRSFKSQWPTFPLPTSLSVTLLAKSSELHLRFLPDHLRIQPIHVFLFKSSVSRCETTHSVLGSRRHVSHLFTWQKLADIIESSFLRWEVKQDAPSSVTDSIPSYDSSIVESPPVIRMYSSSSQAAFGALLNICIVLLQNGKLVQETFTLPRSGIQFLCMVWLCAYSSKKKRYLSQKDSSYFCCPSVR